VDIARWLTRPKKDRNGASIGPFWEREREQWWSSAVGLLLVAFLQRNGAIPEAAIFAVRLCLIGTDPARTVVRIPCQVALGEKKVWKIAFFTAL